MGTAVIPELLSADRARKLRDGRTVCMVEAVPVPPRAFAGIGAELPGSCAGGLCDGLPAETAKTATCFQRLGVQSVPVAIGLDGTDGQSGGYRDLRITTEVGAHFENQLFLFCSH